MAANHSPAPLTQNYSPLGKSCFLKIKLTKCVLCPGGGTVCSSLQGTGRHEQLWWLRRGDPPDIFHREVCKGVCRLLRRTHQGSCFTRREHIILFKNHTLWFSWYVFESVRSLIQINIYLFSPDSIGGRLLLIVIVEFVDLLARLLWDRAKCT